MQVVLTYEAKKIILDHGTWLSPQKMNLSSEVHSFHKHITVLLDLLSLAIKETRSTDLELKIAILVAILFGKLTSDSAVSHGNGDSSRKVNRSISNNALANKYHCSITKLPWLVRPYILSLFCHSCQPVPHTCFRSSPCLLTKTSKHAHRY